MRLQNCHILLLIDNIPVHIIDKNINLMNVVIHFLSLNTTAHLQSYDIGIIKSFKSISFLIFLLI